ncbi:MAG: hypothetical protein OHK0039_04690 [Bacteroidia bacterium]
MIHYLLMSSLLSWVGGLGYLLLRGRTPLHLRKQVLLLTIGGSLLLPLLLAPAEPQRRAPAASAAFGRAIDPQALRTYCRCENPDYTHRLRYRTNAGYNLLLDHKRAFAWGIFGAMGLVLLRFGLQLGYLRYLLRQGRTERIEIDGQACWLLYTRHRYGVGTFWLGRPYIIWQDALADLSADERLAVFRHEWAHLRHRDTLLQVGLQLLHCLWLLNPAFYFVRRELRLLSECLADEAGATALPSRQAYARLLLKVGAAPRLPLAQALRSGLLRARVKRLLRTEPVPVRRWLWVPVLLVQVLLAAPLSAHIAQTLDNLRTYEAIHQKVDPHTGEAYYCPDCETVCLPES